MSDRKLHIHGHSEHKPLRLLLKAPVGVRRISRAGRRFFAFQLLSQVRNLGYYTQNDIFFKPETHDPYYEMKMSDFQEFLKMDSSGYLLFDSF